MNMIICNRPFAAKSSPYLLFMKTRATTFKNARNGKSMSKITMKMAKFEAPVITKGIRFQVGLNF